MVYTLTPVEELKAVKDLLKDESSWCKGAFAKNKNGNAVQYDSINACRYCVNGAIRKVTGNPFGNLSVMLIRNTVRNDVALWNDHPETSHEDVIAALDETIRKAEEVYG